MEVPSLDWSNSKSCGQRLRSTWYVSRCFCQKTVLPFNFVDSVAKSTCGASSLGSVQRTGRGRQWLHEFFGDAHGCRGCWFVLHTCDSPPQHGLFPLAVQRQCFLVCLSVFFDFAQASLSTTPCIRSLWPATANRTSALTLTTLCAASFVWSSSSVSSAVKHQHFLT